MQLGRSLTLRWRDVAMVRRRHDGRAGAPARGGHACPGGRPRSGPRTRQDDPGLPGRRAPVLVQGRRGQARRLLGRALPEDRGRGEGRAEPAQGSTSNSWRSRATDRFDALAQGRIDLLCGAATATLERRRQVAFSIPIFPSGIGALVREDAPERLKAVLDGREPPYEPRWRGSPALVLAQRVLSARGGDDGGALARPRGGRSSTSRP